MKSCIPILLIAGLAISCRTAAPDVGTAPPPCCATNLAPVISFTDKSLYQLGSTWTNDLGVATHLGAWRGRPQVIAMFFARCTYACPIIVHDMQRIEQALPEAVRNQVGFGLITIDTEHDSPAALHAYRSERQLPVDRWSLLCAAPEDTLELAALLGVMYKRELNGQYAHSNLITVLNSEGEIIHQLAGLNQDIGETVRQIIQAGGAKVRPGENASYSLVGRVSDESPPQKP